MRELNESASWLSDVSIAQSEQQHQEEEAAATTAAASEDEEQGGACGGGEGGALPGGVPSARYLKLGDLLNESVTWIDCDMSDSDDEKEKEEMLKRGPIIEPVGYRQGVARSFSI